MAVLKNVLREAEDIDDTVWYDKRTTLVEEFNHRIKEIKED